MFSFEGDFKTRPKVSLGGASRKVRDAACLSPCLCLCLGFSRPAFGVTGIYLFHFIFFSYRWAFKKWEQLWLRLPREEKASSPHDALIFYLLASIYLSPFLLKSGPTQAGTWGTRKHLLRSPPLQASFFGWGTPPSTSPHQRAPEVSRGRTQRPLEHPYEGNFLGLTPRELVGNGLTRPYSNACRWGASNPPRSCTALVFLLRVYIQAACEQQLIARSSRLLNLLAFIDGSGSFRSCWSEMVYLGLADWTG